jgi:iron complex transport system substrate-binding protein
MALLLLLRASPDAVAAVEVLDDTGRPVVLVRPAARIVSLAPHITEALFAAGAGDRIVGTVGYSDHPEGAKRIARIGDALSLDLERIAALRPDVLIVWDGGNAPRQIDALQALRLPIYRDRPATLADVARSIEQFGRLAGTSDAARPVAEDIRRRVAELRAAFGTRPVVPVFYQIWQRPLMTVGGAHAISDVIALCGGRNVFGDLRTLAPTVEVEAVIAADPEVIGTSGTPTSAGDSLAQWRKWPRLTATARENFFVLPPEHLNRLGPRMVEGAEALCTFLERARAKRR